MAGEGKYRVGQEPPVTTLLLITDSGHSHILLPPPAALFGWRSLLNITVYQQAPPLGRPSCLSRRGTTYGAATLQS